MGLRERIAFLGQMRGNFEDTGAVQPSSRFLARAMTAPLRRGRTRDAATPVRILEIGPGTGAVTRAIVAAMGSADELVCYEINAEFVQLLQEALRRDPKLRVAADRITIHNTPAQELDDSVPFDFAVCSAPLNNFDTPTIGAILQATLDALGPKGTATLFEYAFFPSLRRVLASGPSAQRLGDAAAEKSRWLSRHATSSVVVLGNLPPARVHELSSTGS
jgi:phospholipid N-methyltransferase